MHSKFDNIEIMISDKANEIIEKLLNHFLTDIKLQSVTKYYENFKRCVENSASPPIQCCEPMTQLDATFAHCYSTLLRLGRVWKHKIVQTAVMAIIFVTDCLKKCEKLSLVFYSYSFCIKLKACNYPLRHIVAMVSHYLNNSNIKNSF